MATDTDLIQDEEAPAAPTASAAALGAAPPPQMADTQQTVGGDVQAPTAAAGAVGAPPPQEQGWFERVLNGVGNALGGSKTFTVERSEDGKVHITPHDSTPGEKWGRVLKAALGGLSAGASAAGTGPGSLTRAAGASVGAGLNQAQQEQQQARTQANEDFDETQKSQLHKAQLALMGTQNATAAFNLSATKTRAIDGFVQAQNDMHALITQNPLNREIGNVASAADLPSLKKTDPNVIKDFYAGKIKLLTHVNEDGSYGGIDVYHVEPDWQKQMNREPITRRVLTAGDKLGDEPKITETELPANSISNGDYLKVHAADEAAILNASIAQRKQVDEEKKTNSTVNLQGAQAGEARAKGRQATVEAENASGGTAGPGEGGSNMEQTARMMVHGMASPSLLSKRAKEYNQLLPLANRISMAETGKPFDAELSESRYQARKKTIEEFASGTQGDQIQAFNTFLGHAENLSNTVNQLRTTNSPLLNVPLKALRKAAGESQYAAIEPGVEAVRKEYQNFLSNNRALHLDDIKEGNNLLNDDMSLAQMQAAMKGFAGTAITRVGTLNDRHRRVVGGDAPDLLNDGSRAAIQHFGLAPYATQVLGSAFTGQPAAPQGTTQAQIQQKALAAGVPPNAHAAVDQQGNIVGYQDASGYHALGAK